MDTFTKLICTFTLVLFGNLAFTQGCDWEIESDIGGFLSFGQGVQIGIGINSIRSNPPLRRRPPRQRRRQVRRVAPTHYISLPSCPVYGDMYEEWDDGEFISGIDLSDTDPACAEACYEETVYELSRRYGAPDAENQAYHCDEVEFSAVWNLGGEVVTVEYLDEDGERNLEVVSESRNRCDW